MNEASQNSSTPTTINQDLRAAALAGLIVLGGGSLIALGYAWMGAFGVVLAAGADGGAAYWWRQNHPAWFPADLRNDQVGGIAVLVFAIILVLFITIS